MCKCDGVAMVKTWTVSVVNPNEATSREDLASEK